MIDERGVTDGYYDVDGSWHATSDAARAALHAAIGEPGPQPGLWFVPEGCADGMWSPCRIVLEDGADLGVFGALPADLPIGYHRLEPENGSPASALIVHPERAPRPPLAWGVAAQVYSLWSAGSWGIGDLTDVEALGAAAARGAGVALLSPLHTPAPVSPQENSPYSPSSRCWWNPLLLRPEALAPPDLRPAPDDLIDRDAVWAAKRAALWEEFQCEQSADEWRSWAATAGRAIELFGAWNALAEQLGPRWPEWPGALRAPGPAVLAHVAADPALCAAADLHVWLQWRLHTELTALGPGRGPVGLIGDMAVGFNAHGFDAWRFQDLLAGGGVRLGATPDELAPAGQNWGLPPFAPWRVRAAGYRPLIDTLRAVFTGMAGIRIDHVMGLFRQYWNLPGQPGAYVQFPAEELLAIVSVEAHRAGAFVIGEDLGTVPPEVPPAMRERGMLGTRVVVLDDEPPSEWEPECVATLTTHDLPTMAGVLAGEGPEDMRARLAAAAGARGAAIAVRAAQTGISGDELERQLIAALHDSIVDCPAQIRLLTTDDLCLTPLRQNVPGTVGPPNWCRFLPHPVDALPWPTEEL